MDYEQKYKEALERAKQLLRTSVAFDRFTIEKIFPELKESEDEKIRKWLVGQVERTIPEATIFKGIGRENVLAWLENQGEQKPTWSEEDDIKVDSINQVFDCATKHNIVSEDKCLYKLRDWLKSLKERYTWKPSDEQMEALEEITEIVGSHYKPYMSSLYQELKKLIGE